MIILRICPKDYRQSRSLLRYVDEANGPGTKASLVYATFVMICVYLLAAWP